MINISKLLTFEYESEYNSEYDLPIKKPYSDPKIYTANGDLSKRWYIYFSYRNPETNKLQRIKPIYASINNYHTKEERMEIYINFRRRLIKHLENGFNPFTDNTLNHKDYLKEKISNRSIDKKSMTIKEALEFSLKIKEKTLSLTSIRAYSNRIDNFMVWLKNEQILSKPIEELTKKNIITYLNSVLERTSATNRNNFRADLSSLFQVLVDNEIILFNIVTSIPKLKSTPNRNKTYSDKMQLDIYEYLKNEDPILLLYIQFISYNYLRPIEVCRIKVKDINIKERLIQFKAKNSPLKTKIIPEILIDELPDISNVDPEAFLFTPDKLCSNWDVGDDQKRNYFSKRFKKVVKDHFNLGVEHGLYSFRHTFITKLYRELRKNATPHEAKSNLMLITGHASMDALEKYLRDIDAELPADYSEMLR